MRGRIVIVALAMLAAVSPAGAGRAAAGVNIGLNVVAPPQFVIVPGSPVAYAPTVPATVDPQTPVPLLNPRLRGVMQQQVAATMASAPVLKTTVTQFATAMATNIPRVSVSRDLQRE